MLFRSQVVDVTIELLTRHGESGLRIEEVQERTGISKSSLYAAFEDRDGLVAAALTRIYERYVTESIDAISRMADEARTAADLRTGLHTATRFTQDLARSTARMDRVAVIAGTRGRPAYARALTAAQTRLNDALEAAIASARDRGIVSSRHAPRVLATFIQAYTLGRVLGAFDADRPADEQSQWNTLVDGVIDHLLFD